MIESLDQYEVQMVTEFSHPLEALLLRASCSWAHEVIAPTVPRDKSGLNWLLVNSASRGHRDLCVLAKKWIEESNIEANLGDMIRYAAHCADKSCVMDMCLLAKEWIDEANAATMSGYMEDPSMLCANVAAMSGYIEDPSMLCAGGTLSLVNDMLLGAISREDDCRDDLAENVTHAGRTASWSLSATLCVTAKKWIEDQHSVLDYAGMFIVAAQCADPVIARDRCMLVKKWLDESDANLAPVRYQTIINNMLLSAASNPNYATARDLCILAREWLEVYATGVPDYSSTLRYAAQQGNRDLCILAKEWCGTYCDDIVLYSVILYAARGGHQDMCQLAKKWHSESTHTSSAAPLFQHDFNDVLEYAAMGENPDTARDICIIAREWGMEFTRIAERSSSDPETRTRPMRYDKMLVAAMRNPNLVISRDLCVLAHKWILESGVPLVNYSNMLIEAAGINDPIHARECCILIRNWALAESPGPLHYNNMLVAAAKSGNYDICCLAREWGLESKTDMDYNNMLRSAATSAAGSGNTEICVLARKWACETQSGILPDYNEMLCSAAYAAQEYARNICVLARKWEREAHGDEGVASMDYNGMITNAKHGTDNRRVRDLCILARKWIGEANGSASRPSATK